MWVDGQLEGAGEGRTDEKVEEKGVVMQNMACVSRRAVERQEASFL